MINLPYVPPGLYEEILVYVQRKPLKVVTVNVIKRILQSIRHRFNINHRLFLSLDYYNHKNGPKFHCIVYCNEV